MSQICNFIFIFRMVTHPSTDQAESYITVRLEQVPRLQSMIIASSGNQECDDKRHIKWLLDCHWYVYTVPSNIIVTKIKIIQLVCCISLWFSHSRHGSLKTRSWGEHHFLWWINRKIDTDFRLSIISLLYRIWL